MDFSPLRDQPHYVLRAQPGPSVGAALLALEGRFPGVLAYGRKKGTWKWLRLKKVVDEMDIETCDYYDLHVPLNVMWLVEQRLHDDQVDWRVVEAVNVGGIFAWPAEDEGALQTMVEYGRELVRRRVESGEVRQFVYDLLTPYQARNVYWASTRPFDFISFPCGAGKTVTAILCSLLNPGPVAVIAPAKAQRVWWDQAQEYTSIVPHRVIPEGQRRKKDPDLDSYLEDCAASGSRPFVVFRAQSLPDYVDRLARLAPTTLIYDEIHTFGQPKRWTPIYTSNGEVEFERRMTKTNTRETRAVAAMDASRLPSLKLRVGLTATPLDDGWPRRLWAQMDLLAPGSYGMGFGSFALVYCDAKPGEYGGLDDKGASNMPELKDRASFMLHEVTHTESHGQLPPTRVQVVYLDPVDQNRPAAMRREINALEKKAAQSYDIFDKERALEANLMEAASRKRKYVLEEVVEGMRGGGKVVLFTARRADCEEWAISLHKGLEKEAKKGLFGGAPPPVWWGHGGTPDFEREEMVKAFKNSDGPCLLVGTGQAFGESVDGLQTADLAIFAMLPWRPGDFEQWKGRFDRIGGRPTLLKVVLAKKTYDERVAGLLADKIAPIKEFLAAEQYTGLDTKLLGIDDREAMRASLLLSMFGTGEEE